MNESEMSLGYVKKKADSRADKNITETKVNSNKQKYNIKTEDVHDTELTATDGSTDYKVTKIENKNGNTLGHIRYAEIDDKTLFIDMMENYGKVKGAVRAGIAHIIQNNPNKTIYWQAISESSVKSYKKFCEEYPALADKIKFENRTAMNDIDEIFNDLYNTGNEVQNEAKIYSSQYERGSRNTLSGKGKTSNQLPTKSAENINGDKSSGINNRAREFSSTSNNISEQTLRNTNNSNQQFNAIKSKDTRPTEQQFNERADTRPTHERLSEANTIQDVENVLDETVKSDKTIKNRTFAEFMQDGQVQYDKLTEKFGDNLLGIKEAIVKNDRTLLDEICARQAAAEKLISDFQQKIVDLDETEAIPYIEAVNTVE